MYPLIPPGEHHFTAVISRGDDPKASRPLTTTALSWEAAMEYFNGQIADPEYVMDCCDDTVCKRPEVEPVENPVTTPPTT